MVSVNLEETAIRSEEECLYSPFPQEESFAPSREVTGKRITLDEMAKIAQRGDIVLIEMIDGGYDVASFEGHENSDQQTILLSTRHLPQNTPNILELSNNLMQWYYYRSEGHSCPGRWMESSQATYATHGYLIKNPLNK